MFLWNYVSYRSSNLNALHPIQGHTVSQVYQSCAKWFEVLRSANHLLYSTTTSPDEQTTADSPSTKYQTGLFPLQQLRLVSPGNKFVSFDQAQHDWGVESRKAWMRERHADQIANLLPRSLREQNLPRGLEEQKAVPSEELRKQRPVYGINKKHKLLVNRLLKDKGPTSYDWRIPLTELEQQYHAQYTESSSATTTKFRRLTERPLIRRVDATLSKGGFKKFAGQIRVPQEWSQESFAGYVEALTEFETSTLSQARATQGASKLRGSFSIANVTQRLDSLLHETEYQRYLSVEACNTALRFFYKRGMMPRARLLYVRMERLSLDITTTTFNILLQGSASQKDLHNFLFLLHNMILRGFKPNEETWVVFLMAIESGAVRAVIVQKMRAKNMLAHASIKRRVAALIVRHELVGHLESDQSIAAFIDHMNYWYGEDWLSTSAGNIILDEIGKRESIAMSVGLLSEFRHHSFRPDQTSINTLLRKCVPLLEHESTIRILEVFESSWGLKPGKTAHETLFLQAWRGRLLNFAKVVWISACLYGFVTFQMRVRVARSLLLNATMQNPQSCTSNKSLSRTEIFKNVAGRFITGLDASESSEHINKLLHIVNSETKSVRQTMRALTNNDFPSVGQGRLKGGLADQLRKALALDRQWAAEGYGRENGLQQIGMKPHAVEVIIYDKPKP